jgi:Fe-S-cluster containining protein
VESKKNNMTTPDCQTKSELLAALYAAYEKLTQKFHFACREGCSTCCTQSVTLTTIEGAEIMRFLQDTAAVGPFAPLPDKHKRCRPQYTANGYARLFLEQNGGMESEDEPWNFAPCVFLAENTCAIYPVRPFDCRCLVSLQNCALSGTAEMFPALVTLNSVGRQILEHLDDGGLWGNIYDVLDYLNSTGNELLNSGQRRVVGKSGNEFSLLPTEKIPGFLIPPEDRNLVRQFLTSLAAADPAYSKLVS